METSYRFHGHEDDIWIILIGHEDDIRIILIGHEDDIQIF